MIVTIDGPAGAGKSCAARELARRLGIHFLDTGSMYRAIAFAALQSDINPKDEAAVARLLRADDFEFAPDVVKWKGRDLADVIRTPVVTAASSQVAAHGSVRQFLVIRQQAIGREYSLVTEGRDQGTVVFPTAECKFFLLADPVERAKRRHKDLTAKGLNITLEEVIRAQEERDERDAHRHDRPMVAAADALTIDSTGRTPEEVIAEMEAKVRECWNELPR